MPEKSSTEQPHVHLCNKCGKRFECTNPEDQDFEFARCADCKAKEKKRKEPST
jgi:hypothetical protein